MSLNNLQEWLVDEGLHKDLDQLTRQTVVAELDNLVPSSESEISSFDWPRLLLAGSILERSDQRAYQDAALRIATAAITLSDSEAFKDSGAVLLSKLSNFRAIALAAERGFLTADFESRLGIPIKIAAGFFDGVPIVIVRESVDYQRTQLAQHVGRNIPGPLCR